MTYAAVLRQTIKDNNYLRSCHRHGRCRFLSSTKPPGRNNKQKERLRQLREKRKTQAVSAILRDFKFEDDKSSSSSSTKERISSRLPKITVGDVLNARGEPPKGTGKRIEQPFGLKKGDGALKDFKPFFQEVDEQMEKQKKNKERNSTATSLSEFLTSLGNPPESEVESKQRAPFLWDSSKPSPPQTGDNGDASSLSTLDGRSFFDVFAVPDPKPPPDPNAYDEETFVQYKEMMESVFESTRFNLQHTRKPLKDTYLRAISGWLLRDAKLMDTNLSELDQVTKNGISSDKNAMREQARIVRLQFEQQQEAFLESTRMTKDQHKTAVKALRMLGHLCAKEAKGNVLYIAWAKLKEAGIILDSDSMNNYLYVISTSGGRWNLSMHNRRKRKASLMNDKLVASSVLDILDGKGVHSGAPDLEDDDDEEEYVDVPVEVAVLHDLLYEPTEQSVSLRVKMLVASGQGKEAEELLDSATSEESGLRLRTYLPVLRLYCDSGNVSSALALLKRMRQTPTVLIEPETYVQVIATVAEKGYFNPDSAPVASAKELGYSHASGPALFDQMATQMSEDTLEITSASARRLYNAFLKGLSGLNMSRNLEEMHALAPIPTTNDPAEDDELVLNRVAVNSKSAHCSRTNSTLRLIELDDSQRGALRETLSNMSSSQYKQYAGESENVDYAASELRKFAAALENREGEPFTAIVDGANVAYHMQNFDQGTFNFYQIKFMVDALIKKNENPLVIIPFKYSSNTFGLLRNRKQVLTSEEKRIRNELVESGRVFRVPARCLDDYYWILASVSNQSNSRRGKDLRVASDDPSGRWPGARPMIVTNDQMRDHKLQMMEPRLFRRWYSCHIVNYHFTAFVGPECVDREIGFGTADFYTREIQGNPSIGKDGKNVGCAWHFPVSDWNLDDRFCIRIPFSPEQ